MWANAILLMAIIACVVTDLRNRKIYNAVVFPALAAGIGIHAFADGWAGIAFSSLGFALGLGILLIPYMLGGMGAGDVKLLALVGTLKGAAFVAATSVYMALIGGLIALGIVLFKNGFRDRIRFVGYVLLCLRLRVKPAIHGVWTSGAYPYGVAIAGGSAVCLWLRGWGAG
ncbi:prepilin peptidase [Cohnella suwonensis]|uniref:Prepilin peptidase n=1 Tax=Cohnella suwonensis TaxID=696072 RepID=A0ABW0LTV7_9BACL